MLRIEAIVTVRSVIDFSSHAVTFGQWVRHGPNTNISLLLCTISDYRKQTNVISTHVKIPKWLKIRESPVTSLPSPFFFFSFSLWISELCFWNRAVTLSTRTSFFAKNYAMDDEISRESQRRRRSKTVLKMIGRNFFIPMRCN